MQLQGEFIEVSIDEARTGLEFVASEHHVTLDLLKLHQVANLTRSNMAKDMKFGPASVKALNGIFPSYLQMAAERRKAYLQGVGKIFQERRNLARAQRVAEQKTERKARRVKRNKESYTVSVDRINNQQRWEF